MEIHVSAELLYYKEQNWMEWIANVLDKNIGFPFLKKVDDSLKSFSHILSLFSLTGIPCEEYRKALLNVLLKKLNSKEYGVDEKIQKEASALKETLVKIRQAKK
jgi:hypothetical protein